MKGIVPITLLVVIAVFGLYYVKKDTIQNSPAAPETLAEESVLKNSQPLTNEVKIPTHGTDDVRPQENIQDQKATANATANENDEEYTEEEKKIFARSAQETMQVISEKQSMTPEAEFAKAKEFEMDTPDQGMFTGRFIDSREGIKLALYSGFINDSDKGFLANKSCLQTPDTKIYQVPHLKVRYAGNGIALAMAGPYYLRMGMELKGYRVLIAKLYVKEKNNWKYLSDISAQETTTREILGPCKFE